LPRFGIEFGISRECRNITYLGYGPTESYSDKHIATDYGIYETTPEENYDKKYLRPQESGSHYATKYLKIDGAFTLTAEEPFSFSVNPYTTKDICECKHNFELPEHDFYNVCIDLAMRGIGSHSCGPELEERYEIPRKAKNVFKFTF
jgi:beta-galactosidase